MTFREWTARGSELDREQREAVRASNDVRRPADEAVRAHDVAAERYYRIEGSARIIHVYSGGRWISLSPSGGHHEETSIELTALAHVRRTVELWHDGAIPTLPPSTCDSTGREKRECSLCGVPLWATGEGLTGYCKGCS